MQHDTMKAYVGVDVLINVFLTLALARGQWLTSHPCTFTLRKESLVTIIYDVPVGSGTGLENMGRILDPTR
jgi:hypothetical protein